MAQAISTGSSIEGFFDTVTDAFTVKPPAGTIGDVVRILREFDSDATPTVTLIATTKEVKDAFDDFETASYAAQLITDGDLTIYIADDIDHTPAFVSESTAMSLHEFGDQTLLFTPDRTGGLDDAVDHLDEATEELEEFSPRTPGYDDAVTEFEDQFDEAARDDFEAAVDQLDSVSGDVDEVVVAILVGAKHELLHYDIGKWAEDVRIASKATISREKGTLEDIGYVATEKVPMDIGRPRQRLVLGEKAGEGDSIVDLAEGVRDDRQD